MVEAVPLPVGQTLAAVAGIADTPATTLDHRIAADSGKTVAVVTQTPSVVHQSEEQPATVATWLAVDTAQD